MMNFKILAFSDFHGMFLQVKYFKIIEENIEKFKPDVLVLCGDIIVDTSFKQIEILLRNLKFENIFHVWGNSDGHPPDYPLKSSKNLHLNSIQVKDHVLIGIGGDELDCKNNVGKLVDVFAKNNKNVILVSHVPPKDACDLCNDGRNVGVPELRKIIEKFQPKLSIFGHIHEQAGCKSNIKDTICVNVGPSGALLTIENGDIDIEFL